MTAVERSDTAITVAGAWTYEWAARRRPFLHPVRTPAGHVLTRDAPADHPWHHGLWFTIKYVDGENFWEEEPPYGVLHHQGEPTVEVADDGRVAISGRLHWIRTDRESVAIVEDRTWTHVPLAPEDGVGEGYAIDLATTLVAPEGAVLDRTPFQGWGGYGGLTVRGPGDLDEPRLLLADGSEVQQVLGTPMPWLDLSGTVRAGGADAPAGIALFDHPANGRHPSPYYASTDNELYFIEEWTNFANVAFLWDGPLELGPGEALVLRHRVIVHDGHWPHARLAAEWDAWAAEAT